MNHFTEDTWTLFTFNQAITDGMRTHVQYPPRKLQSETCSGSLTLTQYRMCQGIRDGLKNENISPPYPAGN